MARNLKFGVDYFPMNVDMDLDDKMYMIEAKHGNEGFGICVKLLMSIYNNGYYLKWDDKTSTLFSRRKMVSVDKLNEIVDDALDCEFFDREMFDKYGILTSRGIQKRYVEIVKRRKLVPIVKDYFLLYERIDYENMGNILFVDINGDYVDGEGDDNEDNDLFNGDSDDKNKINVNKNTIKERKEKKRKENIYSQANHLLNYLNQKREEKLDKKHPFSKITEEMVAFLKEGYSIRDGMMIIDWKIKEWGGDPKMEKNINPTTLFRKKHRDTYLTQAKDNFHDVVKEDYEKYKVDYRTNFKGDKKDYKPLSFDEWRKKIYAE